jgi:hypothetical protein
MSYVKVTYYDGTIEYYENDTIGKYGEERCSFLMNHYLLYRRIKYLPELPKGKTITRWKKHNKERRLEEVSDS